MNDSTVIAGIDEAIFEGRDVNALQDFIASKGWSLRKYQSVSEYLQRYIINYNPIPGSKETENV